MGFAGIFLQADPRLENALTSVLAVIDGGSRPDNSTQLQIQGWLDDLQTIDTNLKSLWNKAMAIDVGKDLKVDPVRGMQMLKSEGRRLVTAIATALSTRPRRDVYSATPANPNGDTFEELYMGEGGKHW